MTLDALDVLLTEVLLLAIAYVLLLKGLNLRRFTSLGRWLALNNIVFSIAYFCAAISALVPAFQSPLWSYVIRFAILCTILKVLQEMANAFGGWKTLHLRAWHSFVDWAKGRPQRADGKPDGYEAR